MEKTLRKKLKASQPHLSLFRNLLQQSPKSIIPQVDPKHQSSSIKPYKRMKNNNNSKSQARLLNSPYLQNLI